MTTWRPIVTDSESLSGVAPDCPEARTPGGLHDIEPDEPDETARYAEFWVFDCCPNPHLECWSQTQAEQIAQALTSADVELCP